MGDHLTRDAAELVDVALATACASIRPPGFSAARSRPKSAS
jgi:hypothetical protein